MLRLNSFPVAIALLGLAAGSCPSMAAVVLNLNTYARTGNGASTVSGASNTGASITYDSPATPTDIGMVATVQSGSQTPFTQVGDTLTYRFNLGGITATNNNFTPLYRVGFDFGSTAALRYETSTGTQPNLLFGSNTTGNPFSSGTMTANIADWSSNTAEGNYTAIRFDDGNNIDATVTLEVVAINGSLFDYEMTVTYQSTISTSVSNTKNHTFTGVNGATVVSLFHVTNSSAMVPGDAYTISNASLEFTAVPEPATYALVFGILSVGVGWMRRRSCTHFRK